MDGLASGCCEHVHQISGIARGWLTLHRCAPEQVHQIRRFAFLLLLLLAIVEVEVKIALSLLFRGNRFVEVEVIDVIASRPLLLRLCIRGKLFKICTEIDVSI